MSVLDTTRSGQRPLPVAGFWRPLVRSMAWGSVVVVVALWLSGRGAQLLAAGNAERLTSLGRLTGLVAADLLLVLVLLMARVPVIERSIGQDELARRHRELGFWSFTLLLAHLVLITLGYAMSDGRSLLPEAWHLTVTYPGMLLAAASTALLTVVTVTSIRRARRRLRYESWHLLHLYAYLGVGFSLPHEIWTGADFATSPLARAYWWTSYALAAGAVLVYRVGLPLWRTARHGLTVTGVRRESADVVTVTFGGRGLHRLPVVAGQFFVFRFLDGPGWSRGNPYSLSAAPRHDRLQITAKDLGDSSGRLARLRPGTRVLIEGPYGRLTGHTRTRQCVAMLACGIGITPLRALLEELDYAPGEATLVYRARSAADLVLRPEIEQLAQERGVAVHYLTGPRRPGSSWLPVGAQGWDDATALATLVGDLADTDVYVCGPDPWTDAVRTAALRAGLPAAQLHEERFAW